MACFIVPLAEAAAVTAIKATALKKSSGNEKILSARHKLGSLEKMLYGGSLMLVVDHFFSGELSLLPPFLTAMTSPEGLSVMWHEIATTGVAMAAIVTAAWGIGIAAAHLLHKKKLSVVGK